MADYKTYLASSILTEDKVVTYRLLSRALKVNVNVAKEMLYEFHRQQNGKKPGTIHATYLLGGTKRVEEPVPTNAEMKQDGDDHYMQSSPFMPSSIPQAEDTGGVANVLSITLVREEDLEEVRSQYEHISSIHVYSIGPHPLKDVQILSDVTREIQALCKNEDPLEFAHKYGTIINKNVKRRTGRRPPPVASASAPAPVKTQPAKPKAEEAKDTKASISSAKPETKSSHSSAVNDFFGKGKDKSKPAANRTPSKESTPAPAPDAKPVLKRESSSIFKSFAKAKPKLKREGTDSSASAAVSAAEDSPMRDVEDDDDEDDYVPPPQPAKTDIVDSDRKSRNEREVALRAMMEMDDDEDEAKSVVKMEVKEEKPDVEMKEEKSAVVSGRRRGRRRVMKKKTFRDEEHYLVTKEEPVWESFSEDEPVAAPKLKPQPSSTAAKPKKGAAKAGQGNIMSFFGKK